MRYVVIENWENIGYPILVTNEDGTTKVFYDRQEAENEAAECHEGIVIEL